MYRLNKFLQPENTLNRNLGILNRKLGKFTKLQIPSGDLQLSSGNLKRDFSKLRKYLEKFQTSSELKIGNSLAVSSFLRKFLFVLKKVLKILEQ